MKKKEKKEKNRMRNNGRMVLGQKQVFGLK